MLFPIVATIIYVPSVIFKINPVIMYNYSQICFNALILYSRFNWTKKTTIALYYVNKYYDLFDSIIMLMNKKYNQLTFLHWHHHILQIWVWYIIFNTLDNSSALFSAFMNSAIHALMYLYYTVCLTNYKIYAKYVKKYLTMLQIFQFIVLVGHGILLLGKVPLHLSLLEIGVCMDMFFHFKMLLN